MPSAGTGTLESRGWGLGEGEEGGGGASLCPMWVTVHHQRCKQASTEGGEESAE